MNERLFKSLQKGDVVQFRLDANSSAWKGLWGEVLECRWGRTIKIKPFRQLSKRQRRNLCSWKFEKESVSAYANFQHFRNFFIRNGKMVRGDE